MSLYVISNTEKSDSRGTLFLKIKLKAKENIRSKNARTVANKITQTLSLCCPLSLTESILYHLKSK